MWETCPRMSTQVTTVATETRILSVVGTVVRTILRLWRHTWPFWPVSVDSKILYLDIIERMTGSTKWWPRLVILPYGRFEPGSLGVRGQPQLPRTLKTNLDYMRTRLKQTNSKHDRERLTRGMRIPRSRFYWLYISSIQLAKVLHMRELK